MSDTALGFGKLTRVTISPSHFEMRGKRRTEDKCISEHDNVRKKIKRIREWNMNDWIGYVGI